MRARAVGKKSVQPYNILIYLLMRCKTIQTISAIEIACIELKTVYRLVTI